jgi:hypothetical protein
MSSVWEPVIPNNTGLGVNYGPTTSRPTQVLYLYWEYFDTTLNQPVFATQLSGTPIIWVNSAGVAV